MSNFTKSLILVILILFLRLYFSSLIAFFLPDYTWDTQTKSFNLRDSRLNRSWEHTIDPAQMWAKADTSFYLQIAQNGYEKKPFSTETYTNWAFYPLYPYLIKTVASLVGDSTEFATTFYSGLFLSTVFFAAALSVFYKLLTKLNLSKEQILTVFLLFFTFPANYFLNLVYTESLFLLLTLLIFLNLFDKKYPLAFLFLSLAMVTRVTGIVLFPIVLGHYLYTKHMSGNLNSAFFKAAGYSLLSIIPLFLFYNHLFDLTGDFFASFKIQQAWNIPGFIPFGYFLSYLKLFGLTLNPSHALNAVFLLAVLIYSIFFLPKILLKREVINNINIVSLMTYFYFLVLIAVSVTNLNSGYRYLSVAFPMFIIPVLFYKKTYKDFDMLVLILGSLVLQILFFVFFLVNVPVYGF